MSWKCKKCGYDNAPTSNAAVCLSCGRLSQSRVVLTSDSGVAIKCAIDTLVGVNLLRKANQDDAKYASQEQFKIYRDSSIHGNQTGWAILHCTSAKNPTYLDGVALNTEGIPLNAGGVITIGPTRMRLVVSFES